MLGKTLIDNIHTNIYITDDTIIEAASILNVCFWLNLKSFEECEILSKPINAHGIIPITDIICVN